MITVEKNKLSEITATSILSNELCHYTILIEEDIGELVVRIINSTNVNIYLAKQGSDEGFSDITTMTSTSTVKKTVSVNDKFYLIALPSSGTDGTISFDLKEVIVEETEKPEDQDLSFLATNIAIFFILALVGIACCFILKYIDKKFPYKECDQVEDDKKVKDDDAKADLESDEKNSQNNNSNEDHENVGIMDVEESKYGENLKPSLSTFAKSKKNVRMERCFKKLSNHKVMVYRKSEKTVNNSLRMIPHLRQDTNNDSVRTYKLNSVRGPHLIHPMESGNNSEIKSARAYNDMNLDKNEINSSNMPTRLHSDFPMKMNPSRHQSKMSSITGNL